jgi:hypothetical protein
MNPCRIWKEQWEGARTVEDKFGIRNALDYLSARSS